MPTTRFMQFSSAGGGEEKIDEDGTRRVRQLKGISSAHFLKMIEDQGQVGFWTSDFKSGKATVSVGVYRVLGIDPSIPLKFEDLLRIMHPDDLQGNKDMQAVLHSGFPIDREFRIIKPDGTLRWINIKAEVLVDQDGRPERGVGLMTDVTGQYSARRSVEEGWSRYNVLMKSISVMEFRSQANGECASWEGWFDLTGQTEATSMALGWLNAVHPEDREEVRSSFYACLGSGDTYIANYRVLCVDGHYRRFLAYAAPIIGTDGTIREWIGALLKTGMSSVDGFRSSGRDSAHLKSSYIRAARALLNWTVDDLALEAKISVSSVRRLETPSGNSVRDTVIQSVQKAFEAHGVSFTSSGPGAISVHFVPKS